ncbi:MAG TPA: hypothetical protein VMY87_07445 [Armatimonadota bacterium]|nr:hypothetical protein [Armatimonadota bacterium]
MSSEIQSLIAEVKGLGREQRETHDAVLQLKAGLDQRCPNNERRIDALERKPRNGNGGRAGPSNGSMSGRAILAVSGAITALATALATIIARIWGGN